MTVLIAPLQQHDIDNHNSYISIIGLNKINNDNNNNNNNNDNDNNNSNDNHS